MGNRQYCIQSPANFQDCVPALLQERILGDMLQSVQNDKPLSDSHDGGDQRDTEKSQRMWQGNSLLVN